VWEDTLLVLLPSRAVSVEEGRLELRCSYNNHKRRKMSAKGHNFTTRFVSGTLNTRELGGKPCYLASPSTVLVLSTYCFLFLVNKVMKNVSIKLIGIVVVVKVRS